MIDLSNGGAQMRFIYFRWMIVCAVLFLLGACTASPLVELPVEGVVVIRPYYDEIDLSGRFSIQYTKNDHQGESAFGMFNWSQRTGRTMLDLSSPLGHIFATIIVMPDGVVLKRPGREDLRAIDMESLLNRELGWSLPVAGLRDWLQAYVEDARGQKLLLDEKNNQAVRDGWNINYPVWQTAALLQYRYPKRIDLARDVPSGDGMKLKIIIDTWQPLSLPLLPVAR